MAEDSDFDLLIWEVQEGMPDDVLREEEDHKAYLESIAES